MWASHLDLIRYTPPPYASRSCRRNSHPHLHHLSEIVLSCHCPQSMERWACCTNLHDSEELGSMKLTPRQLDQCHQQDDGETWQEVNYRSYAREWPLQWLPTRCSSCEVVLDELAISNWYHIQYTVHLDIAKALDTAPPPRLITRLHGYGIDINALQWIKGFRTERKQRVLVHGEKVWFGTSKQRYTYKECSLSSLIYILHNGIRSVFQIFTDDAKSSHY